MKVLAIRMARFGDIVLLFPALAALKATFPDSTLTFLTDERWTPLAEMCPAIDEIISVDRVSMKEGSRLKAVANIGRLAQDLRRRRFDLVIDFHGFRETNLLSWWSGAPQRLGLQRIDRSFLKFCFNLPPVVEDKGLHVSEMFLKIVSGFGNTAPPARDVLKVPPSAKEWAYKELPKSAVVLFMGAPVPERVWSPKGFAMVAKHVIQTVGRPVIAITSPDQSGVSEQFLSLVESLDGVRLLSGLSIPQLAGAIESARLLISNDTGPMHLGPSLGVPTLGIFSVGLPVHFRPNGRDDRYVQKNPISELRAEDVIEVMDEMLAD